LALNTAREDGAVRNWLNAFAAAAFFDADPTAEWNTV
jgi:hypothetical protein